MQISMKKIMWAAITLILMAGCGDDKAKTTKDIDNKASERKATGEKSVRKTIIFFGNSLTAGYGLDPDDAFPALIQKRLDSLGMDYMVVNAGVSGETTATGVNRVDWVITQNPPEVFVLELGGNDGLRGIPVEETKKNLLEIIEKVRGKYPEAKIVLAGMMIPPNMGPAYSKDFMAVFPDVAKVGNVKLIPFLLDKVGGEPALNLPDGIHPTEEGHRIVAETVWGTLKDVLR
jgi:acyl-CoA thioesterase-1